MFHPAPFTARLAIRPPSDRLVTPPLEASLLEVERIGVIRLGALGDVVRTLPAVRTLRALRPDARLTWVVEPPASEAVRRWAGVDDVLVFPRPELEAGLRGLRPARGARALREFVAELRARRLQLMLDFHSILKSGVIARVSGAPVRVAYAPPLGREGGWRLATHRVDLGRAPIPRFERNEGLVAALWSRAASVAADRSPLVQPGAEARARMRLALGPAAGGIVLHPGTSPGAAYKRWPVERHAALARALREAPGLPVIVSGGPQDEEQALVDAVVAASRGAARRAPPTSDLDDLAALFAESAVFVGADSGALHVASLSGTPVVQIMGPTHPLENQPWSGTPWRRARVAMPCSPCRRGCAEAACMTAISPELVANEVRALLSSVAVDASPSAAPQSARTANR